jgi:hypothetical protein
MLKKSMRVLLAALCVIGLLAGTASAKDEVLLQDMINLEKAYIPPLFFTNQADMLPAAKKGMMILRAEWNAFKLAYYDYKPNYNNWQMYLDTAEYAIQDAEAIVASVTPANPATLILAHEALEGVRMTMLELRTHNGFPKFITDAMTTYHGPMEYIVIALKTQPMSPALIEDVTATYKIAEKAWTKVEKCPVDPGMWGFSNEKMQLYYSLLVKERAALDNFAAALESGDPAAIKMTGTLAIKQPFVDAYILFGDLTPFAPSAP